jgi:hypothetical protein
MTMQSADVTPLTIRREYLELLVQFDTRSVIVLFGQKSGRASVSRKLLERKSKIYQQTIRRGRTIREYLWKSTHQKTGGCTWHSLQRSKIQDGSYAAYILQYRGRVYYMDGTG